MRALIHVQHLLGTGHSVRAAAIARALARRGVETTLATGNRLPDTIPTDGLDVIALPPARAADASFRTLIGEDGRPVDRRWKDARRDAALATFDRVRPDVLVTETYPLGRRAFAFEMDPLIARARQAGSPVAASVRDILVRKPADKEREMAGKLRSGYDAVLVHADPALTRLEDSFGRAAEIADLVRYTGYIRTGDGPEAPGGDGRNEIIVSCGGGAVGTSLLEAALGACRAGVADGHRWRLLLGRDLPEDARGVLSADPPGNAIVETARPDFPSLLGRAALSVSQAGYNTVVDVLATGVRSVLVPFARDGETEQAQRAALLAAGDRAVVLEESRLTADRLGQAIDRALASPPPTMTLNLDGAATSADMLMSMARNDQRPRQTARETTTTS